MGLNGYKFRPDHTLSAADEKVFIPLETAISWVHAFYDNQSALGLLLPISKDFMLTIPTILGNPYVQVDVRVVILYYGALHNGMLLSPDLGAVEKIEYSLYFYRRTLQHMEEWQRQDHVNELSLHVAFWMTYQARFQLDFDLSHRLHNCACQITRDLGLLQIDADTQMFPPPQPLSSFNESPLPPEETPRPADAMSTVYRDVHRIYFWQILITDDHLFRHHLYRPGSIDLGTWKVGLPDFSTQQSLSDINRDTRVHSEASLHLSLIELKYSELLEDSTSWSTIASGVLLSKAGQDKLRHLLVEVDAVLSKWQIEQLLMQVSSKINAYLYAQLIWRATSMIVSFLRIQPCSAVWQTEHDGNLEHEAAHRSIRAMQCLVVIDQDGLYWNLGYFKCFLTPCIGVLLRNILTNIAGESAASDLALTSWVQTIVSRCANERPELKSLELFLQTLNHCAHYILAQKFPSRGLQAQKTHCSWQNTVPQTTLPIGTDDPRLGSAINSDSHILQNITITSLLSKEESEFLCAHGMTVTDLYNEPCRTLLVLEKSLLTEPDPHYQWWTFES
ncbi:hypothetical protein BJX63DRAFT_394358 [Aspergillus granulosus]|uniref:Transcription factor domain-containing protein n=1 Tax=Aspergillus granulosus TaxID=176169 RepID=A0ABR4HE30_9EURO